MRAIRLARFTGLVVTGAAIALVYAAVVSGADDLVIGTNPTWSPDGTRLAFASSNSTTYRILSAPAAGGGPVHTIYSAKNVDGCCDPLLWSTAGRILFDSNFSLLSVSPNGGKPTTLARDISWFILSPNRETAAFDGPQGHSPSSIGLVDVAQGKPRLVVRPAKVSDAVVSFAPDGTELVFSRAASVDSSLATFMVEHVGGGTPVAMARSGLIGSSRLPVGSVDPEWSPDGRWIAFLHLGKLEVVSTTGAASPHTVANWVRGAFSWSPNSKLIACLCGPNREHIRLTTLNPEGSKRTILWANRSLHYITEDTADLPQWSPDGSHLAFLARVGPGSPPPQVWVVGADGTGLKRIA